MAEGIQEMWEHIRIAELATLSARRTERAVKAASSEHWREVYVGVPLGRADAAVQVLEGYVDLLYRRADGLVVVDHKTDPRVTTDDELKLLAKKLEAYRLQLAAQRGAGRRTGHRRAGGRRPVGVLRTRPVWTRPSLTSSVPPCAEAEAVGDGRDLDGAAAERGRRPRLPVQAQLFDPGRYIRVGAAAGQR